MRRKYYVSCGNKQILLMAASDMQACMLFFRYIDNDIPGGVVRVSERGFAEHEDDFVVITETVIRFIVLASDEENFKFDD